MPSNSQRAAWCQVLGVAPQATEDEIRQGYLNLVNVWHPDRFAAPHLKALAEEKLKEIINAYESLEAAASEAPPAKAPRPEAPRPETPPPVAVVPPASGLRHTD